MENDMFLAQIRLLPRYEPLAKIAAKYNDPEYWRTEITKGDECRRQSDLCLLEAFVHDELPERYQTEEVIYVLFGDVGRDVVRRMGVAARFEAFKARIAARQLEQNGEQGAAQ